MAAALLLASGQLVRAEPPARIARVALAPRMVDRMSGVAWGAMTAECDRIWAGEGIVLTWDGSPDADVTAGAAAFNVEISIGLARCISAIFNATLAPSGIKPVTPPDGIWTTTSQPTP